jgi:hypothetical protein
VLLLQWVRGRLALRRRFRNCARFLGAVPSVRARRRRRCRGRGGGTASPRAWPVVRRGAEPGGRDGVSSSTAPVRMPGERRSSAAGETEAGARFMSSLAAVGGAVVDAVGVDAVGSLEARRKADARRVVWLHAIAAMVAIILDRRHYFLEPRRSRTSAAGVGGQLQARSRRPVVSRRLHFVQTCRLRE